MEHKNEIDTAVLKTISNVHKKGNWEEIIKQFKQGARPNIKIGEKGITPLIFAVTNQRRDLCDCLLELGAHINSSDTYGKTALHILISNFQNNPDKNNPHAITIEYLLENRANPNLANAWGQTPLTTATKLGRHLDFIIPLLKHRANVNPKYSTYSPLGWSIQHNQFHVLKILYENGALLHNIDKDQNTAFHAMISKKSSPATIQDLITHPVHSYKQQELQQLNRTIIEILLIFKELNKIASFPKIDNDLQFLILSKLPVRYFYANKELYKILSNRGYMPLWSQVYNHIQYLKKILQVKNKKGETVLDLLAVHSDEYKNKVKSVLDIHRLKEDLENLMQTKQEIQEANMALQIYNNYNKLLLSKIY